MREQSSLESVCYTTGILALGGLAAVASFRHVADAAIRFGQSDPAWLPYALAGTPDLLAVLAGLSIRRRQRLEASTTGPTALLVVAVVVLVAAQLVTAQPSVGGWFAAAWPAIAFLSVVALVETEPAATKTGPVTSRKPAAATKTAAPASSASGSQTSAQPATRPLTPTPGGGVGVLLPVGLAVAESLAEQGKPLNRASLASGLREAGRAASLLTLVKTQVEPQTV